MAKTVDFDRYVAACDYPGVLDDASVTAALEEYLRALKVTRSVRRLPMEWDLSTEAPLRKSVLAILDDTAKRAGWQVPSQAARAALDAQAAQDALAAQAARAARAALAAQDALAAQAAQDALDALAARDALAAQDARAARDAQAALDARDALAARAARAARAALSARAATWQTCALRRFTSWCVHRGSWWWSWDLSWIATTLIGSQQTGASIPWARPLFEAYVAGAWMLYWTEDTLYWVTKPTVHVEHVNGVRRLHSETGPAVESDIENLYFWHGVLVPAFAVTYPEWITRQHIQQEENAEVRRVLIERYGWERWLTDQGGTPISSDAFGDLYRTELDGADIGIVVVKNSTPEPDGAIKRYALLVPPEHQTAHSAVASTFGLTSEQYQPVVES